MDEKLKVCLLNDSFPPTIDGVSNTVFNYASIIQDKLGEAVVATPKYPNVEDDYDFEVVVGSKGDCYDRWMVRIEEMRQSIRIVRQAIEKMPDGPIKVANSKISLPEKKGVQSDMEDLINNFLVVTQGPDIPAGEAYFEADNPKGALGFYVMSKGGGVPYRVKIRAPSFVSLSAMQQILPGHHISDIPVILGSFDFVLGECDR